MRESVAEILVGALVLLIATVFLTFAVNTGGDSNGSSKNAYELIAGFNRADGVIEGSDIRVSGIKIGVVTGITLDPETYQARITLSINDTVRLPIDSIAKVTSDGLLGGSHIALEPGIEESMAKPGDEIEYTRGSVDLLTLLSGFISGSGGQ